MRSCFCSRSASAAAVLAVLLATLCHSAVIDSITSSFRTIDHNHNHDGGVIRRHLLEDRTECVLYLKDTMFEDGHSEETWSCEFTQTSKFGATMIDISGVRNTDLESRGAMSGETIVRLDGKAYVEERTTTANHRTKTLQIPQDSEYAIEVMDWETDTRHARSRRRRNLAPKDPGTLELLVVRVIDSAGNRVDASPSQLQNNFFGPISLKSQYADCSKNQVVVVEATTKQSTLVVDGNETIAGIVDVTLDDVAAEDGNKQTLELEATRLAVDQYGNEYDLVAFCLPPGSGGWIAYAYINGYRSYYNSIYCQRLSVQMHEIGHNLNLAHSGKDDLQYADTSGMMGYSYNIVGGPLQCFNPAKSYQLRWYKEQVQSIKPLDLIGKPQSFTLNGVVSYEPDGSKRNKLVSLRLEESGDQQGVDYYIGYNYAFGANSGTVSAANAVTVTEKENPYSLFQGRDGYGKSKRLAAMMDPGDSFTVEAFRETIYDIIITVRSIDGEDAIVEISTSDPAPTEAPTTTPCPGGSLFKLVFQTDNFGVETSWTLLEKESQTVVDSAARGDYPSHAYIEVPDINSSYCLRSSTCYEFVVQDSNRNGMCCKEGFGFFRGYLSGEVAFVGGEFDDSDFREFCTPATTTFAPSGAPTQEERGLDANCTDDPSYRFRGKKKKTCKRIAKKPVRKLKRLCRKKSFPASEDPSRVWDYCKETCGTQGLGICAGVVGNR